MAEKKVEIEYSYCKKCGSRIEYQEITVTRFVRGDWFGHHPDHYETSRYDTLKDTPCPTCGCINTEILRLDDLPHLRLSISGKEKQLLIAKEKLFFSEQQLASLQDEYMEKCEDAFSVEEEIKQYREKVDGLRRKRNALTRSRMELKCITSPDCRKDLDDYLLKSMDAIDKELRIKKDNILRTKNRISLIEDKKSELKGQIEYLEEEINGYKLILQHVS